jgi:regulator of replication initiation timing
MGKVEILEKEVKALEQEFKTEVEHTQLLKREVEELVEEVAFLKESLKVNLDKSTPTEQIVMEGWLEKKGAIRHNWLRRWFVLEAKKALIYYEKKGVRSKIKSRF